MNGMSGLRASSTQTTLSLLLVVRPVGKLSADVVESEARLFEGVREEGLP